MNNHRYEFECLDGYEYENGVLKRKRMRKYYIDCKKKNKACMELRRQPIMKCSDLLESQDYAECTKTDTAQYYLYRKYISFLDRTRQ